MTTSAFTNVDARGIGLPSTARDLRRERFLAVVVIFLIPVQTFHVSSRSADLGVGIVVLFSPVLLPAVFARRATGWVFCLLIASGLFGIALAAFAASDGLSVNRKYEFGIVLYLVAAALAIAATAWGSRVWSAEVVAGCYAAGVIADGLLDPTLAQDNAWKYAFGWPVAVLTLCLLSRRGRLAQLAALSVLGVVGAAYDDRSFLGFCLLAAISVLVSVARPRGGLLRSRLQLAAILFAFAGLAVAVYQVGTFLALHGQLGAKIEARTANRTSSDHSLIARARPESAAAFALARAHPLGLGAGVSPTSAELNAAKAALSSRGIDVESAYVNDYMFGGHVEVHSIAGDMWADFGLVGLVTAGVMLSSILAGLSRHLLAASPLLVFMAVATLWDMGFSPLPAALMNAAVVFVLVQRPPGMFSRASSVVAG